MRTVEYLLLPLVEQPLGMGLLLSPLHRSVGVDLFPAGLAWAA